MNSCTTGVYLIMNIHGFQSLNIWKTIVGTEAGQPPHLPEDGVLDAAGVDVEVLCPGGGHPGLVHGDHGAVRVSHQPEESLGGGGHRGNTTNNKLQKKHLE